MEPARILNAPDNLVGVAWVTLDAGSWAIEYRPVAGAIPMTRSSLGEAFVRLGEAYLEDAREHHG